MSCIECGRPWGIILERGEEPSPEAEKLARDEMVEVLVHECWDFGYDPTDPEIVEELAKVDQDKLPAVRATKVVYISPATARWISDFDLGEAFLEGCWQEVRYCDIPTWILKSRKQRWAYVWDHRGGCCELGGPEHYQREEVSAHVA